MFDLSKLTNFTLKENYKGRRALAFLICCVFPLKAFSSICWIADYFM